MSSSGINNNTSKIAANGEYITRSTYGTKQNLITVRDSSTGEFSYTNAVENQDGTYSETTAGSDEGYGQVSDAESKTVNGSAVENTKTKAQSKNFKVMDKKIPS